MNDQIDSLNPEEFFVDRSASIRDALERMTQNRMGYAIIVDDKERFQGIVADGDVRRQLLDGLNLDDSVESIMVEDAIVATTDMDIIEREELATFRYRLVPVVDDENRVVDVVQYTQEEHQRDVKRKRIGVVGLGFVGLTLAMILADEGYDVTGIDKDPDVVEKLQNGESHFHEVGLEMYLNRHLGDNFVSTQQLEKHKQEIYLISVGTPVSQWSYEPDLAAVKAATHEVGNCLKNGDLVVLRSTVPVGTTRNVVLPILEEESDLEAEVDFGLVFAPERTLAGRALKELRELPQIIGGIGSGSVDYASRFFGEVTGTIVEVSSPEAAEMCKLIDNTYRDTKFAYANEMALLCEQVGLDVTELVQAVNQGYKRNEVPYPSPGVGGPCLTKDPYILLDVGEQYGYQPDLVRRAREVNESMPRHVAEKTIDLLSAAGKEPEASTVFVLGFGFKGQPETSDTRKAPTLDFLDYLPDECHAVLGYDPVVPDDRIESFGVEPVDIETGFSNSDATVIMTNHRDFESLNIYELLPKMNLPGVFIDGWHLFEPEDVKSIDGVLYGGVGND